MKQTICPNCGGLLEAVTIGWKCKKCKGFISLQDGKFFEYVEKPFMPPQTNADRIRAMSDEELAGLLAHEVYRTGQPVFEYLGYGITEEVVYVTRLKWLKQPVGDE